MASGGYRGPHTRSAGKEHLHLARNRLGRVRGHFGGRVPSCPFPSSIMRTHFVPQQQCAPPVPAATAPPSPYQSLTTSYRPGHYENSSPPWKQPAFLEVSHITDKSNLNPHGPHAPIAQTKRCNKQVQQTLVTSSETLSTVWGKPSLEHALRGCKFGGRLALSLFPPRQLVIHVPQRFLQL